LIRSRPNQRDSFPDDNLVTALSQFDEQDRPLDAIRVAIAAGRITRGLEAPVTAEDQREAARLSVQFALV